jgi:DNA-binding transcriptional MerR regulator
VNNEKPHLRTARVAELAGVTLRQLQVWEEQKVVVATRSGRVRRYTTAQALFVMVLAEFRRRGLSFQRARGLTSQLHELISGSVVGDQLNRHAFILTDGRKVQFADSQNKTCELVLNFSRPIVCVNLGHCLDRVNTTEVTR